MKRSFALILAFCLLLACASAALAVGEDYNFAILANEEAETTVPLGDEVTVTLQISRADGSDIELYSAQDYVRFDPEYMEFVEGSIVTWPATNGTDSDQILMASPLRFAVHGIEQYNEVYVNRSSNEARLLASGSVLLQFRLKTLKNGTTTLTHEVPELFLTPGQLWSLGTEDAIVHIGDGGVEPGPGPVDPGPGPGPIPGPGPVEPTPPDEPDKPVYQEPDWVDAKLTTADHFNYVIGYPDGTVHPTANITRAEVATIFYRLLTEESRAAYGSETNEYADVNAGDWFNTAISTLSNVGVLKGYPDGNFYPNRNITRAELTAVITRFVEQVGGTAPFSDVDGHWAYDNIAMAAAKGWINGYDDGTFRPDREITRAETFAMVNRMLGRRPETKDDLHSDMITFPDNMDAAQWYYLDVQEAANNHDFSRKADGLHETWTAKLEDIRW